MFPPTKSFLLSCAAAFTLTASFAIPCQAGAVTISTADGRGADVTVSRFVGTENTSSVNAGAGPQINAKPKGRKIYLRFDLSKVSPAKIKTARLVLTTSIFKPPTEITVHEVYGLNDGSEGDREADWTEKELTWDNAPQNSSGTVVGPDAALLGEMTFKPTAEQGEKVIFSERLADFLRKDRNGLVTIVLLRKSPEAADFMTAFSSKEDPKGTAPKLEIETAD